MDYETDEAEHIAAVWAMCTIASVAMIALGVAALLVRGAIL